jgi:drug/metabolite transporter (DMT)-like permease
MSHKRATLLLVITATLWSLGGVLIKSIPLHALAVSGVRSFIAALVLLVYARKLKFIWTPAQFGSAFFFSYTVLSFVLATKLTTAANAILLQYTAPIYVALLSGPLLGERIGKKDLIALGVVLVGMALFFLDRLSGAGLVGNLVALTSGISFGAQAVCLRKQKGESTLESLFLGHCHTVVVGLPFLLSGPWPTGHDFALLGILGVVQLGIPYVLYGIAIRHVSAMEASLVPVLEPILNPIWVALFTAEIPSTMAVIGGAVVIGAVVWHSLLGAAKKTLAA